MLKGKPTKLRKQEGYDNVFIFPGLPQRLLTEAQAYLFKGKFEQAIELYEEVERLEPNNTEFYDLYVLALYEAGEYSHLIPYARVAIESMERDAFELFKLLNLSLLQLGRFEEVQDLLQDATVKDEYDKEALALLCEYAESEMNVMTYGENLEQQEQDAASFSMELLLEEDHYTQLTWLNDIQQRDSGVFNGELVKVVENQSFASFVRTSAFSILKEQQYDQLVHFDKFDLTGQFIPKDVPELGEDDKTAQILTYLNDVLAKEPSLLQYAIESYEHVVLMLYPHTWPAEFEAEEIAEAFVRHVKNLVSGLDENSHDPLLNFIRKIAFQ